MTIPPVPLTNTQPAPIALPARWECSHGPTDDEAYCLEAEDESHVCPTIRVHPDDAQAFAALVEEAHRRQSELCRERDLAIAHDRQPYPTAWAYEQACTALHRKTEAIERVLKFAASLDEIGRQLAGPDAVHPVAAHIRHLLTQPAEALPDGFKHETCVTVACTVGDYTYDEDEFVQVFASAADAKAAVIGAGWSELKDGRVLCESDDADHAELRRTVGVVDQDA